MTTAAAVSYDMYDRDIYASPYAVYRQLRDEAPLYYNERYDFFALSRFDDVASVLSDNERFISGKGMVYNLLRLDAEMPPGLFICEDPPRHTVHRALVSRLFTPRAVNGLEPQIRKLCAEVAGSIAGTTRFDFVTEFAAKIPIRVIGMLLGLPERDQTDLHAVFHRTVNEETANQDGTSFDGIAETSVWFMQYLDERAEHPTDDVMSRLLYVEFEDETGTTRRLQREEIVTYLTLIASAGSDTTATAVGWAAKILAEHPDQRRALVADRTLVPNAVEEILRFEPPSYHIARTAVHDVEFHGCTVPAGSAFVMLPGAANRDERRFTDGDAFDISREPSQLMTFSFGPHFCLGASLARMEVRIVLETILDRFGDWTVDLDHAEMTRGIDTRGWDSLPIEVERT
jgi:cytochrome P450